VDYSEILYDVDGRVATLTFNRPEQLNPMTVSIIRETVDALGAANADRSVRAVIVTGAGRAFSAGGDLSRLGSAQDQSPTGPPGPYDRRAWLKQTQKMVLAFRECEKPVIAAVNGVAAGGGCDIALACDIRFASDRARFGEVFARIGLFPGTGGTYLLPRTVGIAKALEMIWTGDLIDAAEAERIGLVNRVVPHDELMAQTRAFAERLADGPPLALSLAKAAVYRGLDLDLSAAFDYAATAEAITLTSQDHREGVAAFREKRTPTFEGR
jgi:2-(1,2-epoxy-1,2-dihydrophenyl)acetyl-CoA isomerase